MTPPPGAAGGLHKPYHGSLVMTVISVALGHAARMQPALHGRLPAATINSSVVRCHQRHSVKRAFDRDRPVRLRDHGGADGPLLRWAGAVSLAVIDGAGGGAHTEDMLTLGRTRCAGCRGRSAAARAR